MNSLDLFAAVMLAIVIILIVTQIFGKILSLFGQPRVIGEIIAGVLLGPTLFGAIAPEWSSHIFSKEVMPTIFIISNLGLAIYMFLLGAEIEFDTFKSNTIKQAGVLSFVGLIVPFGLGFLSGIMYYTNFVKTGTSWLTFSIYMGTALAITAFPMLARILHEKNLIKTKIGIISLISASLQDVVAWILLSFVTSMALKSGFDSSIKSLIWAVVYLFVLFFVIKPILNLIAKDAEKAGRISPSHIPIILILLLSSALVSDKLGFHAVFGGFIFGLIFPRKEVIQKEIHTKLRDFNVILFLPLFFAYSGINTNLLGITNLQFLIPCIVIILFAFIGKYGSNTLTMKLMGFSWRESSAIGGLTNARGMMELVIANIGLVYGIITNDLFSILVLTAIFSTILAIPIFNMSLGKDYGEKAAKSDMI